MDNPMRGRLVLVVLLVAACQQSADEFTSSDADSLRALHERWLTAERTMDTAAFFRMTTADVVLMLPGAPVSQGHDALRRANAQFHGVRDLSARQPVIVGSGSMAYLWNSFSGTYLQPTGDVRLVGKYLWILRKGDDGTWRVAVDVFNSDR